jgi:hypothetical protein
MRVWQAQFYFTDKDLAVYGQEDKTLTVSERRRYYRINWRELRFFRNSPGESWPENISGKVFQSAKIYIAHPPSAAIMQNVRQNKLRCAVKFV